MCKSFDSIPYILYAFTKDIHTSLHSVFSVISAFNNFIIIIIIIVSIITIIYNKFLF